MNHFLSALLYSQKQLKKRMRHRLSTELHLLHHLRHSTDWYSHMFRPVLIFTELLPIPVQLYIDSAVSHLLHSARTHTHAHTSLFVGVVILTPKIIPNYKLIRIHATEVVNLKLVRWKIGSATRYERVVGSSA